MPNYTPLDVNEAKQLAHRQLLLTEQAIKYYDETIKDAISKGKTGVQLRKMSAYFPVELSEIRALCALQKHYGERGFVVSEIQYTHGDQRNPRSTSYKYITVSGW